MASKAFSARITSKNQLTLLAALVSQLSVEASDVLKFELRRDGTITVSPPTFAELVAPLVGILKGRGKRLDPQERAKVLRDQRGSIDE